MDLSPRDTNVAPAPRVRKRQWRYVALLSIVVVAGVVFVSQFLNSAIDYYYASRLPNEAEAVDDIHLHPIEPRSFRLSFTKNW